MITIIHNSNKFWTTWVFVVLAIVWMNLILLPCVHAASFDQETSHECPHCPAPDESSCHSNDDCSDCDAGNNIIKSQKVNIKLEDNQKTFALPSWRESDYANEFNASDVPIIVTITNYISPPIYLKNCVFLN
jgi:hypothetical protein